TASTFTEIANYGVEGATSEMIAWQNYLFIAVFQKDAYSSTQPDFGMLHKVDISDPYHPVSTGSIEAGANNTSFGNLRMVNNVLISHEQIGSILTSLLLINPFTLEVTHRYPAHYRYEVILDEYLITRPYNASLFELFSVHPNNGLVPITEVSLPYPINTFPSFVAIDDTTLGTQCEDGVNIWRTSDLADWEFLSAITHQFYSRAIICNGYLVCGAVENTSQRFYIYDITDPSLPELVCSSPYPPGLGSSPIVEKMIAHDAYLFHPNFNYGCVCLKITDVGQIEFVSKCYRFNSYSSMGRRYGSFILQPIVSSGVAVFDISDLSNPEYTFSMFEGYTSQIDLHGDLLYIRMWQLNSPNSFDRIYNVSDLYNPVLVYGIATNANETMLFNHEEPDCFYLVDSGNLWIDKYSVISNQAQHVLRFPISMPMKSTAFVNNQLYASVEIAPGVYDLYTYTGFSDNLPQQPTVVSGLLPNPGLIYGVGEYLYIYNPNLSPTLSTFYNQLSSFQVDTGHPAFNFLNYVCVGRENGISLYNTNENPSGYQDADYFVPQFSTSIHIDWDDNYFYLFAQDNIAIYSYQATAINDNVVSPVVPTINCYPNPFTDVLKLDYTLNAPAEVLLEVYNIKGQLVKRLISESKISGKYNSTWTGMDESGSMVTNGVYIMKLSVNGRVTSLKKVSHIKR
ncbi:MAG: T9SS type A sorting domain-containing protein, partial [Candidatus Syntrophosphaera sp.]